MTATRKIEIFSAGCGVCQDTIARISARACPSCDIIVHDMNDTAVVARAEDMGIASLPAIAIDGVLARCCTGRGPDLNVLEAAGLGQPLD